MNHLRYAGDTAAMKVSYAEAPVRSEEVWFALSAVALAALPLMLISLTAVVVGLLGGAALGFALTRWSRRLIGGYTGDVLGAVVQVAEIGFLLGVAAVMQM